MRLLKEETIRPIKRTPQTRPALLLVALVSTMLAATACAAVTSPQGWAGPVAVDGTVLASTDRGELSALKADDLSPIWTFPAGGEEDKGIDLEAVYGTPVVEEGVVYFGAYDGKVYALDLANGRPKWLQPFETGGPIIAGVVVADGSVYVASDDGKLYVLDAESGSPKRPPFDAGDSIWARPLLADGALYVAAVNGKLFALEAETLDQIWEPFEADGGLLSDPVLTDSGTILVGGIDRRLHAVSAATGEEEWSFKANDWFWGRPLVSGETIYAPNLDGRIYALDAKSGDPVWEEPFQTEPKAPIRAAPVLADDVLVVVDRKGAAYGLDPNEGKLKWSGPALLAKTVLADPLVREEDVLISAQGGDLFSIDPASGSSSLVQVP